MKQKCEGEERTGGGKLTDCAEAEVERSVLVVRESLLLGQAHRSVLQEVGGTRGHQLLLDFPVLPLLPVLPVLHPPAAGAAGLAATAAVSQGLLDCEQTFLPPVSNKSLAGPEGEQVASQVEKLSQNFKSYLKYMRSI